MSDALTDLKELLAAAEKPCRCPQNPCPSCNAEEQLKSHAISFAEELANSQVALKFARARAGVETRHWKRCCPFLRGAIAEFVAVADAALADFEKAMER